MSDVQLPLKNLSDQVWIRNLCFCLFSFVVSLQNDVRFKETIEKCTEINGITTNIGRYKGRPIKTSDLQTSDWYNYVGL